MKILALAGSTSSTSINKALIGHIAAAIEGGLIEGASVEVLDLGEYEMPIYSTDRQEQGIPEPATRFFNQIGAADALIISHPEHNGTYSAAFKNLYDWTSRIDMQVYQGKPLMLLAASPGGRGGASVLELATSTAGFFGADVRASLSVPNFSDRFDMETGTVTDPELQQQLEAAIVTLGNT